MEPTRTPRTARPSADKRKYTNGGDGPVVFTDTPEFQAKPHRRRRRAKTLAKGGMYFTRTDRELMEWIAAFGWVSTDDLARLMGSSRGAVRNRGQRLVKHRLLAKVTGPDSRVLYLATRKGLRYAGLKGFKSDISPKPSTLEHTKAMVGAVLMLRDTFPKQPALTERELFAAIKSNELTPRIARKFPWIREYSTDFERWQPVFQDSDSASRKSPDLLMLRRDKTKAVAAPIPVEVELTVKPDAGTYKRWLVAYENAAAEGHLAPGIMFLVDDASDVKETLERTFTRLDEDHRDPISGRTPWSRLSLRIDGMGAYFQSYRRAWGLYLPPPQ